MAAPELELEFGGWDWGGAATVIASRSEEAPNTEPYHGRSETQTSTLLHYSSVDRRVVSALLVDLITTTCFCVET